MAKRTNPQNVIDSYKRRQRMTPIIVGGLAALLVIAGVVILFLASARGSGTFCSRAHRNAYRPASHPDQCAIRHTRPTNCHRHANDHPHADPDDHEHPQWAL